MDERTLEITRLMQKVDDLEKENTYLRSIIDRFLPFPDKINNT